MQKGGEKGKESDKENEILKESESIDELYMWLEDIKLSRPKKNLARDFSDGLLMAELLKQFFPRNVDLNNYRPANSLDNKMKNWIWLNDKVFKSLGIGQTTRVLRAVASTNLPALEKLLLLVKEKVERDETRRINSHRESLMEPETAPISPQEYALLNDQLQEKTEEVSILNAKIQHLEAMLDLKSQRIEDLTVLMRKCTCQDKS